MELEAWPSACSWGGAVGGPFPGKLLSRFSHCNPCKPACLPAGGGPAAGPLIKPQRDDVQGLDRTWLQLQQEKIELAQPTWVEAPELSGEGLGSCCNSILRGAHGGLIGSLGALRHQTVRLAVITRAVGCRLLVCARKGLGESFSGVCPARQGVSWE